MTIKISDVPQANSLKKVLLTTLAVHNGAKSFQEIAGSVGFTNRQARYYRRACELLGLVETKSVNSSQITKSGSSLLKEIEFDTNKVKSLKKIILKIPIVSEVLDSFENEEDVQEGDLLSRFIEVSGFNGESATARRRLSTFVAWMKEIELFAKPEGIKVERKSYRINKNIMVSKGPFLRLVDSYETFVENINLHLKIPYESNIGKTEYDALDALSSVETVEEVEKWLEMEGAEKLARLLVFKSEADILNPLNILSEKQFFESIELSYGRLLIETDRAMRGLSASISKGGNALEALMATYCKSNKLEYKKDHLFKGLSKNVDFFVPELNLAIECKFSKTSGTKHGGALKDLMEQSKGKEEHGYKLAILIAGKQYAEDEEFCSSIFKLKEDGVLDVVLTPADLKKMAPKNLLKCPRVSVEAEDLVVTMEGSTTWSDEFSLEEVGLDDASRWLERFLSVNFLDFKSQLYTWVGQTPFAIQVLRLIIGWSESKMSAFIKASVEEKNIKWKKDVSSFKNVSILVDSLVDKLEDDEIDEVKKFFTKDVSLMDFLVTRESALRGSAIRKKDTSKIFIQNCMENSEYEIFKETFTQELPSGAKVKSSFKVKKDGKEYHVLCKYYAGSGSVMSDFVKTMCGLSAINKHDEWIFIIDGPGWLDRQKDLNRMISHVTTNKLNFYNLYSWSAWKDAS